MIRRAFRPHLVLALPTAIAVLGINPAALDSVADPGAALIRAAEAAVSIQISLDELVATSSFVVVATATEQRSQWEELGGARRIVTYTRLTVDRPVAGESGKDIWVRTLGGAVGKVGQYVSGDARFSVGKQALLFLARADATVVVAGMAQGHYPVVEDSAAPTGIRALSASRKLAASPDTGAVLPRRGPAISAHELLVGATLDQAIDAVNRSWKSRAAHAPK